MSVGFDVEGLWKWREGRQGSGYEKFLLLANPFILPFDCYLLRFREGAFVPEHTDPVTDKRHYRVNVILKSAKSGGEFGCDDPIYESKHIKFFRSDKTVHSVSKIADGTRYVLSIGWVRNKQSGNE